MERQREEDWRRKKHFALKDHGADVTQHSVNTFAVSTFEPVTWLAFFEQKVCLINFSLGNTPHKILNSFDFIVTFHENFRVSDVKLTEKFEFEIQNQNLLLNTLLTNGIHDHIYSSFYL